MRFGLGTEAIKYKSTWSYENRVRKHFVIFLNFHCLIACFLFNTSDSYLKSGHA